MASLGDLMVTVGARIEGFTSAMRDVVSQANDAAEQVADKLESIGDVGQRLAALGASLTAAITLPLEEIARRSIDVAGQFEQTSIAFTTLLGGAQASKEMLASLYTFAATTPFELPQVLQGARQIMAFGFSSRDIIPILRTVGDAVAALGTGQTGMQMILANLGKMKTEGHATSETLNHLAEDGINSWQMLANAMGKSIPEVQQMVTKRQITSDQAINALLAGMNTQFGGLMSNQMASFSGMMSNFKDQVTLTAVAIGQMLLPAGKVLIDWAQTALGYVKDLAQWFSALPAPVIGFAVAIAALAAAVGPALVAIGGLGMAIPMVSAGLVAIAGVFGISVAALAPWALAIGAALAALTALGVWVYGNWAGIRAAVVQVFDGIGEVWNATVGGAVRSVISLVSGPLTAEWIMFKTVFMGIWDTIGAYIRAVWIGIKTEVIDPMMSFIEKIPGMQKILSAGSAFEKGNTDKSAADRLGEARTHLLGGSGTAPKLSDPGIDWTETHNRKLQSATADLQELKKAFDQGKVSADEFAKATARVDALKNEKNPFSGAHANAAKAGGSKIDHNALDGLSGAHAHEEAQVSLQRAQIEHDYQMAKPGSAAKVGESAEDQAKADIAAAEKRKSALDATYADELKKALANLDAKMALYKSDQAGHEKLLQAKTAAEDRYKAAVQKTTFDLETIKKQAEDRIQAAHNKQIEDDLKAQQKSYEMAVKTVDLKVQALDKETQFQIKQSQFNASLRDKDLQFELETGHLSKAQYLRLKQEQYDAAYAMEVAALEQERDLIESEFAELLDKARTPEQRQQVMADRRKRTATLDDRQQQVENRHTGQQQDTKLGIDRDRIATMDKNFFTPFENGFSKGISNMVKGIQTFKQAWSSMMTGMLSQWIDHVAQMVAQWVTAKLRELVIHATTNQAKVASDRAAALQSKQISVTQHMHEVMLAAKLAAAKTWAAVSGIPVIGPILAPVAAAAAFAGVFAISAESGAVLPNHNTVGFLHPQEMVLPKGISVGLQNLIASGGLSNADGIMNQAQGGTMSSTALQMMRNTASADTGDTHHNYHGPMHYHAAPGESMNVDTFGKMFKAYVRQNNYKMA